MDLDTLLKALALGVLEGLTEFLPISSTGHLIIASDLLGFTGQQASTFKIFIQLGAIFAVCWLYRDKLIKVTSGLHSDPVARRFTINIAIAFLPAAILGLLFYGDIQQFLFSPVTVAIALIVGGVAILLIERLVHRVKVETVDEMSWREALKIGLAQSLALVPGVSRSGATIMGGLVAGLSRKTAAEFSFFLAIPIMFSAAGYALLKNFDILRLADVPIFAAGFLAAFASALASIKFLITYLGNHSFTIFAWYRIVFGLVVLGYYTL